MVAIVVDRANLTVPLHCNEKRIDIKLRRCPLKKRWGMPGLSREEVADMRKHPDAFDDGFSGSVCEYSMDLRPEESDDSCIVHFWPKGKQG